MRKVFQMLDLIYYY